jgi:rhodanese-related sulfurtransferase
MQRFELTTLTPVDALDMIDLRTPSLYSQHHVQGALNIPIEQLVSQKTVLQSKNRLILLGDSLEQVTEAYRLLQALGVDAKAWCVTLPYKEFKKHTTVATTLAWVEQPLGAVGHVKHWYGQLDGDEKKLALGSGAVVLFTLLRSLSPVGLGLTLGSLGVLALTTRKRWQPHIKKEGLKQTVKQVLKAWLLKRL